MTGSVRGVLGSIVLAAGFAHAGVDAATIDAARVQNGVGPDPTRVEFDVSSRVPFEVSTLENPHRVVVDLDGARPRAGLDVANTPVAGRDVTQLRGAPRDGGYRIVIDVADRLQPNGYMIAAPDSRGDRLIVELKPGSARTGSVATAKRPATKAPTVTASGPSSPAPGGAPTPKRAAGAPSGGARDFIVAIDAGHGGDDPGAIGVGKVREKDVTLAIARELTRLLNDEPGYRGDMTRTGDYYLTLRQRTTVARKRRADLFVSVHADSLPGSDAAGASVYTLSAKGATNETARWLAEKENASDLIGGAGDVSLDDKDALLAHVLLDLSMDASRSASIEAASAVLASLNGFAQLHREGVEQAGFVVLKSPDMPSILVETGYLSNPRESRNLSTSAYQRQIARAIFKGITAYARQHPPPGTALALQRQSATHDRTHGDAADLATR